VIRGFTKTWVELPDPLARIAPRGTMIVEKVFDLVPEVAEIGADGQAFGRHTNSPFGSTPDVRIMQAERFVRDVFS
jgi:hypothetical protein